MQEVAPDPMMRGQETLARIGELLRTQDNRITSYPLFVVEEKVRVYGVESGFTDLFIWQDPEDWENSSEVPRRGWNKVGYSEVWKFVTACFTEQGCLNYLERNGHNHQGETRIYVYSAHRNREWQILREFLISIHPAEESPE